VLVRRGPQHQLFSEEVQHERDFLHSPHSSPEIPQGLRRHEEGTGVRLQHQSPRTRPGGTGGVQGQELRHDPKRWRRKS
jgi:hypothetical protein